MEYKTPEHIREWQRMYYNKPEVKARYAQMKRDKAKEWRRKQKELDPEGYRAKCKAYSANRKAKDPLLFTAMSHNANSRQRTGSYDPALTGPALAEWMRVNNHCVYCGETSNLSVDHKIPLKRGGSHALDNIQRLCRKCNTRKNDSTHDELLEWAALLLGRT